MPNRLADETSPYLLQHKDNPVDWYPWGEEALNKSRDTDKPIFLSIGYSACHWCHVMEHESFEDPTLAALMNQHFICVKVDREERPDIDQIYMNAVQLMTGHGGWPMSVFLTPDLKPFYGGTYWPPKQARGMPGFDQVIAAVTDAWQNRRDEVTKGAEQLTTELRELTKKGVDSSTAKIDLQLLFAAGHVLERTFDRTYGGFGSAPKFPHTLELQLLLRIWKRTGREEYLQMVCGSLDMMAAGGIYDHLGGGFARYSVDARWLVPHFEKMLYDNALLAATYLEAYQVTGNEEYQRIVRETLDYILRDMTDERGGFYSAEDADSEGVEGKFYVWTPDEVEEVLGRDASMTFCRAYDVSPDGNFEGKSILHLPKTLEQLAKIMDRNLDDLKAELAASSEKLLEARAKRVHPGRDDKVIVAWNGLMIDAMARAGAVLNEPKYVDAARRAADFILAEMRTSDGRLLHTWRAGVAKLDAYLDDYTTLAGSLVSLYEATFDEQYIAAAAELVETVVDKFGDNQSAGYFYTADDHEQLLTRTKDFTDNATPGGNSMAATTLLRLGTLLGRTDYLDRAEATLTAAAPLMEQMSMGTGQMLLALDLFLGPLKELVFVGPGAGALALGTQRKFLPNCLFAARESTPTGESPLSVAFENRVAENGQVTLYACHQQSCQAPVSGEDAIKMVIDSI